MLNYAAVGFAFDERDLPREAAWAYEIALALDPADLGTFINLVVLYFWSTEYGFAASHRFDSRYVEAADQRWRQLMDTSHGHGSAGEVIFWSQYFAATSSGKWPTVEFWIELAASTGSELPFICAAVATSDEVLLERSNRVLAEHANNNTARSRLLRSIASTRVRRHSDRTSEDGHSQ